MCRVGRRQIARHTDWKRTGGALGITRVDACAPFGFGLRRIFPPKAFAFFGTSTTNTHNGLHTDARRTFPIAQAPHRACRAPHAVIRSRQSESKRASVSAGASFLRTIRRRCDIIYTEFLGGLAQLVRAGPLHGQGRGFESLILHQVCMYG